MTASPSTPSDILKFPALVSLPEPVPAKAASPSTIFFPVLLADMSDEGLRRHSLICNRELVRRREAAYRSHKSTVQDRIAAHKAADRAAVDPEDAALETMTDADLSAIANNLDTTHRLGGVA
jgi:hypothetical protein